MSVFVPLILLVLPMLIQGFLQLTPATFTIFYHHALAKFSRQKSDDLALSFILGTEFFTAIMFLCVYYIVSFLLTFADLTNFTFWLLSGIFFALSLASAFCYYRKSPATALFIPRRLSHAYTLRASTAKSRTDCFLLGFFSGIPELLFTLPLFMLMTLALFLLPSLPAIIIFIIYIIIATIPLFVYRTFYRIGYNLATITRIRIKMKPYVRLILSLSYFFIALTLIYLGATYGPLI